MKREPSIHIKESKLAELFESELGIKDKTVVKEFLLKAYRHSVNGRQLLVSNDKLQRNATKMLSASLDDTLDMAKVIYQVRKNNRHRGIILAKAGTRDWDLIKDIAKNAVEFCNAYELNKRTGFIDYIKLAIDKMQKFGLNKISSMHDGICEDYGAIDELNRDPTPELTHRAYTEYNKHIFAKLSTIMVDYTKIPGKYVCFMKAAQLASKLKSSPELFIKAQFKGLDWQQGVPDPMQLVGDKSVERMQKYLYEFGGAQKSSGPDQDLVNKLKNLKHK